MAQWRNALLFIVASLRRCVRKILIAPYRSRLCTLMVHFTLPA